MPTMPTQTTLLIEQALGPLKDEGVEVSRINLLRAAFEKVYNQGFVAGWKQG